MASPAFESGQRIARLRSFMRLWIKPPIRHEAIIWLLDRSIDCGRRNEALNASRNWAILRMTGIFRGEVHGRTNCPLRRGSRYIGAQGRQSGTVQRDFCKKAGITMSSAKDTKLEDSELCDQLRCIFAMTPLSEFSRPRPSASRRRSLDRRRESSHRRAAGCAAVEWVVRRCALPVPLSRKTNSPGS